MSERIPAPPATRQSSISIGRTDLTQIVRGYLMGAADIVPGVSGGTVALILGIYERLVSAISHCDFRLADHVRHRDWSGAARHIDLRFLIFLGAGIALGICSMASLMHHLLTLHMSPTFAVFCGMIFASTLIVARMIDRWDAATFTVLVAGAVAAWWVVELPFMDHPPAGLWYLFASGAIAICAMILPGISGALILLILGKYVEVTGYLKDLLHGQFSVERIVAVLTFCFGCLTGLLVFSKCLRWLLQRHGRPTLALLCGFMLGSLRKLWPFKDDLTPTETEFKLKQFRNIMPDQLSTDVLVALTLFVVAASFVLLLDMYACRRPTAGNGERDSNDQFNEKESR